MTDKSHCLLLRDAVAGQSRDDCHACAMEGKMGKADSSEKTVPITRSLGWHFVSYLLALFFHFPKKWPQSRDQRSGVATTSFNGERDFVLFCIDIFQRKGRFAKAATLANCDFKGDAHPGRLRSELFPYQPFFFRRDLVFIFGKVRRNAEPRTGIDRGEFPCDRFEHDDAPDANVEQGAVETNRTKPRVLRGILTPLQILSDMFSFQLARPVHTPRFQKRAYRIPGLLVFRESVSFPAVARLQKRNDPSIKVFFVGNASGVGLFLTSLRFELTGFRGFRAYANTAASGLVADFSSGIAKLYPPVGRAIALVDGSHGVTECHQCHQFCQLLPKNTRV